MVCNLRGFLKILEDWGWLYWIKVLVEFDLEIVEICNKIL